MVVFAGMILGLLLLLIVIVLFKDRIPFKFMCNIGLHKSPEINDKSDCVSDFYTCERCDEEIPY